MAGLDPDEALERDMQKVRRARGQGFSSSSIPEIIEAVMWTGVALTVTGMIVALPFVGADKLIPGNLWLGMSMLCILLFGGVGMLLRAARAGMAQRVDRQMDQTLRR